MIEYSYNNSRAKAIEYLSYVIADLHIDEEQERPSDGVVKSARHALLMLPNEMPLPEISVEPDGSIAFDWAFSRNSMFSITVLEPNKLVYAWIKDGDSGHGVVSMIYDALPERIITLLKEVCQEMS